MNPNLCRLIKNSLIDCYLSDQQGLPLSQKGLASLVCEELMQSGGREDVAVMLPSGESVTLQKVNIIKRGYLVIEIIGSFLCVSEPIPFELQESVLLCAPEGTEITCDVTDFNCRTRFNCQNDRLVSLDIFMDTCQDIKALTDVVIAQTASFCQPRENFIKPTCSPAIPGEVKIHPLHEPPGTSREQRVQETICFSVPKVYDWIISQQNFRLNYLSNQVVFHCVPQ
ncbi:BMQ_0737 family morphogenetic spore coat protein [Falsibacillus albus]|uniref:Uncharacterized protein n=1 Tax=Falsibacillus albus TaxID=2478915 RepID=A0A3L7K9X5_9BACI|nr:hypothetical protein [Falsibacillus albus]RLQ97452.1 hypothetical protein D9X91_04685 [Falsibacillus albus]